VPRICLLPEFTHTQGGSHSPPQQENCVCKVRPPAARAACPSLAALLLPPCRIKGRTIHCFQFHVLLLMSCEECSKEPSSESVATWSYSAATNSVTNSSNIKVFLVCHANGVPSSFICGHSFQHRRAGLCYNDWRQLDHVDGYQGCVLPSVQRATGFLDDAQKQTEENDNSV